MLTVMPRMGMLHGNHSAGVGPQNIAQLSAVKEGVLTHGEGIVKGFGLLVLVKGALLGLNDRIGEILYPGKLCDQVGNGSGDHNGQGVGKAT